VIEVMREREIRAAPEDLWPVVSSPERLAEWLDTAERLMNTVSRLYFYASMFHNVDTNDQAALADHDRAIGMYTRDVAIRTRDRLVSLERFEAMTPERARALAAQYGLDYLVTEQGLELPLAFESGGLHVYRLR